MLESNNDDNNSDNERYEMTLVKKISQYENNYEEKAFLSYYSVVSAVLPANSDVCLFLSL